MFDGGEREVGRYMRFIFLVYVRNVSFVFRCRFGMGGSHVICIDVGEITITVSKCCMLSMSNRLF